MRKTIATLTLALGAMIVGVPTSSSAVAGDCLDSHGNPTSCDPCYFRIQDAVESAEWTVAARLQAVIDAQAERLAAKSQRVIDQRATIHNQRRTIRHLRAELRDARG